MMTLFNYLFLIITEVKSICYKRTVFIGDKDVQISLEKRKHMIDKFDFYCGSKFCLLLI